MSRAAPLFTIALVCTGFGSGGTLQAQGVVTRIAPGDVIRFTETRPMSKDKRWRFVGFVERAR